MTDLIQKLGTLQGEAMGIAADLDGLVADAVSLENDDDAITLQGDIEKARDDVNRLAADLELMAIDLANYTRPLIYPEDSGADYILDRLGQGLSLHDAVEALMDKTDRSNIFHARCP
jgi:hypothetical protein